MLAVLKLMWKHENLYDLRVAYLPVKLQLEENSAINEIKQLNVRAKDVYMSQLSRRQMMWKPHVTRRNESQAV